MVFTNTCTCTFFSFPKIKLIFIKNVNIKYLVWVERLNDKRFTPYSEQTVWQRAYWFNECAHSAVTNLQRTFQWGWRGAIDSGTPLCWRGCASPRWRQSLVQVWGHPQWHGLCYSGCHQSSIVGYSREASCHLL